MTINDLAALSRRDKLRAITLIVALIVAILWVSAHYLQPAPSRHIVMASGPAFGLYHRFAERYKAILARDGVVVEERMTEGAVENLRLVNDPHSGVDVAFVQGGVAGTLEPPNVEILANLYYEPLWVFYRSGKPITQLNQLQGLRVAVGAPGSGTRAFVLPLLAFNGVLPDNSTLLPLAGDAAIRALQAGEVDAALLVGGAQTPVVDGALHDPTLRLMSFSRADAYTRHFSYITKLTLPPGTVDFAHDIPAQEVVLIGTKAMLGARAGLHPALVNLLVDAATEVHGKQGYFEAPGEFPSVSQVDLPVSADAERHKRFGPSFMHRVLPFWVATFVERFVIIVLPLLLVVVPLINYFPEFLRWRVRSRVFRWYGELAMLERHILTHKGPAPTEQWLRDIDRIEHAVEEIKVPTSLASEAYTLREHVAMVRRTVLAKASAQASAT